MATNRAMVEAAALIDAEALLDTAERATDDSEE